MYGWPSVRQWGSRLRRSPPQARVPRTTGSSPRRSFLLKRRRLTHMAKQQIIRSSTIGNDPFASIIPTNEAVTEVEADGQLPSPQLAEAPANPAIPKPFKRQK